VLVTALLEKSLEPLVKVLRRFEGFLTRDMYPAPFLDLSSTLRWVLNGALGQVSHGAS
jgi:hypothetical protein